MLSCGNNHAVILDDEGNLYGWGFNGKGQLALQDEELDVVAKPKIINFDEKFKYIVAKEDITFAISKDGKVYRFGY